MKAIKILTTICLFVCAANIAMAQTIEAKFAPFGGKKDQRDAKRVYISDFAVKQLVRKKGTAKAGGGLSGKMAFAHMTVDFGSVDPEAYQKMVTDVYGEVAKRLASLGYEVVGDDEAKTKITKETKVFDKVEDASNEMNVGLVTVVHPKGKVLAVPGNVITSGMFITRVAKDLDAATLAFNFTVDYVSYEKSGGGFANKASIEAEPNLWITGLMSAAVARGASNVTTGGVKYENDWVGSQGLYLTSKGKMSPLFGVGVSSSSSSKYTIDINQEKYLAYLKSHLLAAANASIDAWRAGIQ